MRRVVFSLVAMWVLASVAAVVLAPVFLTLVVLVAAVVGTVAYRRGRSTAARLGDSMPTVQQAPAGTVVETTVVYQQRVVYPPAQAAPIVPPAQAAPVESAPANSVVPDHVPAAWVEMNREGQQ